MSYTLSVIAYDQNPGMYEPARRHWSILLQPTDGNLALCRKIDIQGMPGHYRYVNQYPYALNDDERTRIAVCVGSLPEDKVAEFEAVMAEVPIKKDDPEDRTWNCQGWVMDALEAARQKGFTFNGNYSSYAMKLYQ